MPIDRLRAGYLHTASLNRRQFAGGALAVAAMARPGAGLASDQPKAGGLFRLGLGSGETQDNLDPAIVNNPMTQILGFALRNCLVEIGRDNEPVPELAESWEVDRGARRWVFNLRKGVTFHNGKPFTAADALYSIEYHRNDASKSVAKPLLTGIESMRADGDQLVFELTEGSADFPYALADYHLHMVPEGATQFDDGMGTGAYVLEEFVPGQSARLRKNAGYWKAGRGHFAEVEVLSIKDFTARQNALLTGAVDLIDNVAPQITHILKQRPGIVINESAGLQHYSFPMLTDTAPFDNVDVRLALKYAIDRQDILNKILAGYGRLGNDQPISSANRYFDADLPQRPYDPDQARFHLRKAGQEGLKVELRASDVAFTGAVNAAQLYREHAAKAGINLRVIAEPGDGYWSNVWLKQPWCTTVWYGRPTEDWMFTLAYARGADWNDTRWSNERFEALLKQARAELDEAKRRDMYHEMQALVCNDGGALIPVFASYLQAHNGKVATDRIAANYPLDGFRLTERWWTV